MSNATQEDRSQSTDTPDQLTGHAYDGIQEYDNPLPRWWTWLFVATVLFSLVYFPVVQLSQGKLSPIGQYEQAKAAELQGADLKADAATVLQLSKDDASLKIGAGIFASRCAACHQKEGQGLVGPNLTDDFYINVRKVEDIYDVVTKGRNNGQMPPWGGPGGLSQRERVIVSAYVASLRGKNLPGKAAEPNAVKIAPWTN